MDNNQNPSSQGFNIKHRVYLILSVVTALVFTVLQTDLLFFHYETDVMLFSAETAQPDIMYPILAICIAVIATSLFFFRKEAFPDQIVKPKSLTVFISAFCGFTFLVLFGYNMFHFITGLDTFTLSLNSGLKFASYILAVPSSLYFLVIALKREPYKKQTAVLGFCVVLWATLNLMGEYFGMNSPMNDPIRIIHQISYISIMLFYLYDAAHSAEIHKPVLYQLFGYTAIILISFSSIPAIVLSLLKLKALPIDMMSCYVEFCLLLFVICRMFSIKKHPQNDIIREDTDTNEN